MGETTQAVDLAARAEQAASAAAQNAGVRVAELEDLDEIVEASRLWERVWATGPDDAQVPPELLRALAHAGNYAAGAFSGSALVGAVAGFLGRHDGELHLHSHILGVVPEVQGRSVGFALKQHQRAWCLTREIEKVTWTYDPLVRRNAYFNLAKLGAEAGQYLPNFYGIMTDAINAGEESDRILMGWRLVSPRAVAASERRLSEPDLDALRASGARVLLREDERGEPVVEGGHGRLLLCRVPEDIVALRARDAGRARAWRLALRETLGDAMVRGFAVTGMTRSGWYVLEAR